MTAVSDAGPLIALAKLGATGLLHATFTEVSIPEKVFAEVVLAGESLDLPDATDIRALVERGDISVVSLSEELLPDDLRHSSFGMGEKDAMALALRDKPDWLLIDDAEARAEALELGLPEGYAGRHRVGGTRLCLACGRRDSPGPRNPGITDYLN